MQKHDPGGAAVTTYAGSEKLLAILSLRSTVVEVDEASTWLSGDSNVFGAIEPVKGNASHIITILMTEEEEEPRAG